MTLSLSLTYAAHRQPPSSGLQLSRSVAWTLGRRVSPSAKHTSIIQQIHFGVTHYFWLCWGYQDLHLLLLTIVRVVKVTISDGSSLGWGRRGLEEGGGGWHVVQCALPSASVILSSYLLLSNVLTDSCDWCPEWRIYNVMIHDTTQCLLIVSVWADTKCYKIIRTFE